MLRRFDLDLRLRSPIGSSEPDIAGVQTLPEVEPGREQQEFGLSSESFEDGGVIPERLAREWGVSPQLSWINAPEGTDRFVIIVDDPDAQPAVGYTFVHWLVALPASYDSLKEGVSAGGWTNKPRVLSGAGTSTAYKGPRPPSGIHRYHIAMYAMSRAFVDPEFQDLAHSAVANDTRTYTREYFESRYHDNILASAKITGVYAQPERPH
ncbi:MAG TPA: YbhB/YbcL family Raf kinase inhibitor-like protein [Gammaproteobacteria bacterium]